MRIPYLILVAFNSSAAGLIRPTADSMTAPRLSPAQACALARSIDPRPSGMRPLLCEPQKLSKSRPVTHPEWFVAYQLIVPDTVGGANLNRGFFAVNRITGSVWNVVLCEPIVSPAIRENAGAIAPSERSLHRQLERGRGGAAVRTRLSAADGQDSR